MPEYVVKRTMLALNEHGQDVKGSRVMILGFTYKADVDDIRESPTFELLGHFSELGANVSYHDLYLPRIGPTREHAELKGVESAAWNRGTVAATDAVVIPTAHKAFNRTELAA